MVFYTNVLASMNAITNQFISRLYMNLFFIVLIVFFGYTIFILIELFISFLI